MVGLLLGGMSVSAFTPYKTYSYSHTWQPEEMPHVYQPDRTITGESLGVGDFSSPNDVFVDTQGNVLIADSGNNRVVVLNPDWTLQRCLDTFDNNGQPDALKNPSGLYREEDGTLYVADTGNARVVKFDADFRCTQIIGRPETDLIAADLVYMPVSVATDKTGRVYVIAQNVNDGILQFSAQGGFEGFIGAQRVVYNPLDFLWKQFMTDMQNAQMVQYVPTGYSNMAVSPEGFLYVTSSSIDADELESAIQSPSQDPRVAPVKMLNPSGSDVLQRKDWIFIAGDIQYAPVEGDDKEYKGPSIISDIALGSSGTYTLLDTNRNRFFTYSSDGSLLYVFGGYGDQFGTTVKPVSIAYKGTDFLALDINTASITLYRQTEYGERILSAIDAYNHYKYDEAEQLWTQVLDYNANADIAYEGIGQALLRKGDYTSAMEYFRAANDTENYSIAFRKQRDGIINRYIFLFIPLLVAVVTALSFLFKKIKAVNVSDASYPNRGRLRNQLCYGFYAIWHPFNGFWDIKKDRRGSVKSATILLAAACLSYVVKTVATPFIFQKQGEMEDVYVTVAAAQILVPVLLWVVANWCLTSLLDGEGSLRDIYVMSCYALFPIVLFTIPVTLASFVLSLDESMYLSFFGTLPVVWTLLLLFAGSLVIHQYTLGKNLIATLLTVGGMGVIIFLVLVFTSTLQSIGAFFSDIWTEIAFRF